MTKYIHLQPSQKLGEAAPINGVTRIPFPYILRDETVIENADKLAPFYDDDPPVNLVGFVEYGDPFNITLRASDYYLNGPPDACYGLCPVFEHESGDWKTHEYPIVEIRVENVDE